MEHDGNAREHLANERTFLAWIRTSLGLMAFGFVVEKFALFIKELGVLVGNKVELPQGYSSLFGPVVVAAGALIALLAYIKYKKVEKQIERGRFSSSSILNAALTLVILGIGFFLIFYLSL